MVSPVTGCTIGFAKCFKSWMGLKVRLDSNDRGVNILDGVHCSSMTSALMAWLLTILFCVLHCTGVRGGWIIENARMGSVGSCSYTTLGGF